MNLTPKMEQALVFINTHYKHDCFRQADTNIAPSTLKGLVNRGLLIAQDLPNWSTYYWLPTTTDYEIKYRQKINIIISDLQQKRSTQATKLLNELTIKYLHEHCISENEYITWIKKYKNYNNMSIYQIGYDILLNRLNKQSKQFQYHDMRYTCYAIVSTLNKIIPNNNLLILQYKLAHDYYQSLDDIIFHSNTKYISHQDIGYFNMYQRNISNCIFNQNCIYNQEQLSLLLQNNNNLYEKIIVEHTLLPIKQFQQKISIILQNAQQADAINILLQQPKGDTNIWKE